MQPPAPFIRESGAGPAVVCLHSNASSSSQWRALGERLAPRFRVLAPDLLGAGKSPPRRADHRAALQDELELLEPVFERAGESLMLVGHSYGAAVALVAALARPQRVRAMALYEPTLFSLIDARTPPPNDADGIRGAVAAAGLALDAGNPDEAARCFIDYWMGDGAWAHTPEARKGAIRESMADVRQWAAALLGEPAPLQDFVGLDMPVLYMSGRNSPASSLGVASLLTRTLPRVQVLAFDGLGHMGPVTHPERVNEAIAGFLEVHRPS